MPETARERSANPRAGAALAPHSGQPSGKRPSVSELIRHVTISVTNVNSRVTDSVVRPTYGLSQVPSPSVLVCLLTFGVAPFEMPSMGRVRRVALIAAAFFVALLVIYGFDWQMTTAVFFVALFMGAFLALTDPFAAYEIGRFLLGRQDKSDH
jgi:hypothetical protein